MHCLPWGRPTRELDDVTVKVQLLNSGIALPLTDTRSALAARVRRGIESVWKTVGLVLVLVCQIQSSSSSSSSSSQLDRDKYPSLAILLNHWDL